jgi:ABC-2 type transport system permease protein
MTAPAAAPDRPRDRGRGTRFVVQSGALSRRAIVRLVRQPSTWIPGILFPLLLLAVNSSAMARVANLPGVLPPGTTLLMFLLPAAIVQGVMFGGINGGSELATDIQTGFFDRLISAPVARPAILVGRLGGAVAFGVFQAVLFQVLVLPFGGDVEGGLGGRLVLVAVAAVLSLGFGAFAAGVAARTGQPEAVQGFFPLVFISLFLSSCFFPVELMSGWYKSIAEHNPITWMVDGMRYQVLVGFSWSEAATSIAVSTAIAAVSLWFATAQVRYRVREAA